MYPTRPFKVIKTVNNHLNKMMRSGKAVSSYSGSIPFETVEEKRGGLPSPISRKMNLISLRSVAFVAVFVCNLVHSYKFHNSLETA